MKTLTPALVELSTLIPEMAALKARLKATWMAGDYGRFAQYLEPGALEFLTRLNLRPGMRLLDVATGAGQIAIPAARALARPSGANGTRAPGGYGAERKNSA